MSVIEELRKARREKRPVVLPRMPPVVPRKPSQSPVLQKDGLVGTELAKMKPYVATYKRGGCSGGSYADQMDRLGVKRCRQRMDVLLDWMEIAAPKQGWNRVDAKVALLMAITRAEQQCR